ncbi:MAG: ABC transporter permease [Deltaproteobacteria bacterium]|nr:ABC transporter permease [Deltaproteobacteria bacterium]
MGKELKKAYYIARKDLKAYYLKPPLISWGLMLPIVFILAFYLRNPQGISEVSPGLVGMTMLFSTTSMAAIVISFEKRIDALERLLMAPISLGTILFGKGLGAAAFGFVMALISLVLMIFVFGLQISYPFSLLASLIISCFAFAFLGILISVGVREVFEAMTLSNFFRFPMIFLCGVFFPIISMPIALQVIGFCLPLTYSVDALRQSLLSQGGIIHRWLDILVLAGFCFGIFEIALAIFRKRTQESN